LTNDENPIVITSTDAVLHKTLPKKALVEAVEFLEAGEEVDRDILLKKLEASGYQRTSLVEERGDYSLRGGVIDIFPPFYSRPLRLEFWGDLVESIRFFDTLSQRSTAPLGEVIIIPVGEIIRSKHNIKRARDMGRLPVQGQLGGGFPGEEAWLNHFYSHLDSLFDYVPENGLIILLDSYRVFHETERLLDKALAEREKYEQEAEERAQPFPELDGILLSREELERAVRGKQCLEMRQLAFEGQEKGGRSLSIPGAGDVEEDLGLRLSGKGKVSLAPLADKVSVWLNSGFRVIIVSRTEQQAERLSEILGHYHIDIHGIVSHWQDIPSGKGLTLCLGRIARGFAWPELGLYVISEDEIFGSKRPHARRKSSSGEGALNWTSFSQLSDGDLIVHQDHGIGRYGGLIKMEIEGIINDFVLIEYAAQDRLYVPAQRISILQKYVGAGDTGPKLDQLGGRSWQQAKAKAKRSIMKIARQLVELYALRRSRNGFAFSRPDSYFREFEATFEHEETADQIKAIEEILEDLASDRPMDRLVCGDVGFGKTEVAIRAAFKAILDGKQVAILVPTTVLAEQHYDTFVKRFAPYEVRVGVLSRFKRKGEQKELIAKVRSGQLDILIGTHRILQKDVSFKDLGLLIIDEEHRFGVKQKEAVKKFRALVDVLALTATPIPRTLQLSLTGIRDLSIIETAPEDRLAIQTYLSPYDEPTIARAIRHEMERKGQTFFVHNRVQTIDKQADRLREIVPEARYAIAHGQMKGRELEDTMMRFIRKEVDVLVCTTIIESGLDIPSANTIIINQADRFGLAQIYQLRGRVGRSKENAYAYLLLSASSHLTRDAEKRLRALMDFSHLGAGINLAMHDLRIRGGGNMLGYSQAGHISAIGYELYMKMIEQNVAELKGESLEEEINPEIHVHIPAYLPSEYVLDTDIRLNLYRRLSSIKDEEDLARIVEEMRDRFGPLKKEVSNLIEVMSIRLLLVRLGVCRLDVGEGALTFTFHPSANVDSRRLVESVSKGWSKYQFLSDKRLKVLTPPISPLEALGEVRKVAEELGLGSSQPS
jgi:transcription-repair coupling factor (superfamily II helicase)